MQHLAKPFCLSVFGLILIPGIAAAGPIFRDPDPPGAVHRLRTAIESVE